MAQFVVTHGGRAILNDIILRGIIYAVSGRIGGFDIGVDKLKNTNYSASVDIVNSDSSPTLQTTIGYDAIDIKTGEPCSMVAQNIQTTNQQGGQKEYNTALSLLASGAKYNFAFNGTGNGMLNGVICGYKTSILTLSQASTQLDINNGTTFLITDAGTGAKQIIMPKATDIAKTLGDVVAFTPHIPTFSIEINILYYCYGDDITLVFRGYNSTYQSDEYPFLHYGDDIIRSGGDAAITMSRGDAVKLLLLYYPYKQDRNGLPCPYQAYKLIHIGS